MKKTEGTHDNSGAGFKEQQKQQQPQNKGTGAPDLKKAKSTNSNTMNRFSAIADSDD